MSAIDAQSHPSPAELKIALYCRLRVVPATSHEADRPRYARIASGKTFRHVIQGARPIFRMTLIHSDAGPTGIDAGPPASMPAKLFTSK